MNAPNSFRAQPDERGHFGDYGGRYVAETLMPLILDPIANTAPPRLTLPSKRSSTIFWNITSAAPARSTSPSG
jgi:hypothetical protein